MITYTPQRGHLTISHVDCKSIMEGSVLTIDEEDIFCGMSFVAGCTVPFFTCNIFVVFIDFH